MTNEKVNKEPIEILLAEDNEDDIHITLRAFKNARIKNSIHVVRNGEEAYQFLKHEGTYGDSSKHPVPDLILLDINMPKMSGFEFLDAIKKEEKLRIIPVVMLTSSENDEDIVRSYKNGAVSYIKKPVDFNEFVKVVDGFNFYWHIINRIPHVA